METCCSVLIKTNNYDIFILQAFLWKDFCTLKNNGQIGEERACSGMKKMISVVMSVVILFLLAGCVQENVAEPTGIDTRTIPLIWGVRYMYSIDEGRFADYVRGEAISESHIGEKIEAVFVTVGVRNNVEKFWVTQETRRAEVYAIDGIAEEVAVALKFIDEGEGATTTHYYVMMNPSADLTELEGYKVSPYVVGISPLTGWTNIFPTVKVNGQLYRWKMALALIEDFPESTVYYGDVKYVYGKTPRKDCEFMSVFMVSGEIYTVPDNDEYVYLRLTTDLTPEWLNETVVIFELSQQQ